ncbi:MAG: carbohydrate ABC transporter permease [Clostridiales bacterium]|nr:carbohydrate ABC transporter permease [Clostridiales bacterium]
MVERREKVRTKDNKKTTVLTFRRLISYIVLILMTFICLFPFYILIINATRAHSAIQQGFSFLPGKSLIPNWNKLMSNDNLPVLRAMFNSFFVAMCTALFATYFSALTAYAIHTYRFKIRKVALSFILMIMMVPTQVSALGFIRQMNAMGLDDSFIPLIIPAIASPVVFFFMLQYMEGSLPIEIVEAARIDGSGEYNTFNMIVLPIIKPAMSVQAIFSFVGSWNNYFIPNLLLESKNKKTIPILIAQLRSADFMKFDMGQVYILIAISIIPVIIVYMFFSKYIVQGVAIGSVKG